MQNAECRMQNEGIRSADEIKMVTEVTHYFCI